MNSHRQPVRVQDIAGFDAVIDARSPAEFALDHIPGALNLPVLDARTMPGWSPLRGGNMPIIRM